MIYIEPGPGQKLSLALGQTCQHLWTAKELLNAALALHPGNSFFCSTMMTWSQSSPFPPFKIYKYRPFTITSGPHFQIINKSSISVREGFWGFIFKFEGTSGGPCRELILSSRAPLWMLHVHCYCCLLWLKLWLRLKLRLHSAQKQGKRGEGFTCSNSHTKGHT
jgi:hypothetical protein